MRWDLIGWKNAGRLQRLFGKTLKEPRMDRAEKALHLIDRNGLGLEIGPSHNPLAPKRAGFRVEILDHAGAGELREKYRSHGVNIDNIEEVDYVWRGEPLDQLIGKPGAYDYIIASHVIEHTPDLIAFLQQCEKLLKPAGVLSLVIPDKRYCFDYLRWPSSTGDVLQAHYENRRAHAPGVVFDHFSTACKLNGNIAWGPGLNGDLSFVHMLADAQAMMDAAKTGSAYIDVHQWRFTPSSFRLILSDLNALQLASLSEVQFFDTVGCEFFVALSAAGKQQPAPDRLQLSLQIVQELQAGFL